MSRTLIYLLIVLVLCLTSNTFAELIAHWQLDESSGSIAQDTSGNDNNGTLNGNPQWVTGKIGGAILLDGDGEIRERLESTGIPLGMFAERSFSSGPTLLLEPGEMVVLFTDGITEAGVLDGNAFGTGRSLEFIKDHRHDAASNIVKGLCRTAQSFEAKRPQVDDMTVVICKLEAAP